MKALALLALLAAGCSTGQTWFVDARFTETERQHIQKAADTWTTPIDLVFGAEVSAFDTDRRVIVKVDQTTMRIAAPHCGSIDMCNTVNVDETRILVKPISPVPMWYRVAHELGHGMGMEHVNDNKAIMYPGMDWDHWTGCVTQADADEYERANGVRIRTGCAQ